MPSPLHELYAYALPRARKATELDDEETELGRIRRWQASLPPGLPTRLVPGFARRYAVVEEDAGGFASYVVTPRRGTVTRTLVYLHGGAFIAPLDPAQVPFALKLARALDARLVVPDYPLAPDHTWRDSHTQLADLTARWAGEPGGAVLLGDSAGGGLAVSVSLTLRDRGGPHADRMVLHSPWVDLTLTAPGTDDFVRRDPWLHPGKGRAYGRWWAGSDDDLRRPEVSPVFADLAGLPPALMFYGTRDLVGAGCRLLSRRATSAGWAMQAVEEPGLIHVYGLMPGLPEARRAFRRTVEFCR